MFATTSKAAARVALQFRSREVSKRYLVGVDLDRVNKASSGVIPGNPVAGYSDLQWKVVHVSVPHQMAVLEVGIQSGRKHQIRKQLVMAGLGPVVGDVRYGYQHNNRKSTLVKPREIYLHAAKVTLRHPIDKPDNIMTFQSLPSWPRELIPCF